MGRPANPEKLSRYMMKKMGISDPTDQSGVRHKVTPTKHASPEQRAAKEQAANATGTTMIKKLIKLYADQLESGIEGVSSKCHYQGLTGLARSFANAHPDVKELMQKPESSLTRLEKNAIAAYGFEVLMGNV